MAISINDLNQRSVEIFRELVDAYVETGEPVGSRTLSRRLTTALSPATIRNVMADLEEAGLLYAPHTSAGRLPTELGMRFFVHGLLQVGDLSETDRKEIEKHCTQKGHSSERVLEEAIQTLSGLSKCAGLVMAPKTETPMKHVEFIVLDPASSSKESLTRCLMVLIHEDGLVENRVIELPAGLPPHVLKDAAHYINNRLLGMSLSESKARIHQELREHRQDLDQLTQKVVEEGLAVWGGQEVSMGSGNGSLIIKGQSHLLENIEAMEDLDRIRELFDVLDRKEKLIGLLDASIKAQGVQIFVGSENSLFELSGCSIVVAPYHNKQQKIIGAIGVVGPTRMNYGRIIPLVDYTAKIIGRIIG